MLCYSRNIHPTWVRFFCNETGEVWVRCQSVSTKFETVSLSHYPFQFKLWLCTCNKCHQINHETDPASSPVFHSPSLIPFTTLYTCPSSILTCSAPLFLDLIIITTQLYHHSALPPPLNHYASCLPFSDTSSADLGEPLAHECLTLIVPIPIQTLSLLIEQMSHN